MVFYATVFYFYIMKEIKYTLIALFSIFLIISCSGDSDEDQDTVPEFDRSTILKNYVENIIIPRYNDFKVEIEGLKVSINDFTQTPNTSNLQKLHDSWLESYKNCLLYTSPSPRD